MHRSLRWTLAAVAAVVGAVSSMTITPDVAAAATGYSVATLHFKVTGTSAGTCDVVGDVYRPAGASASNPAPAILTTNGFAGSKDTQAPFAKFFAQRGYVVLSYSGLGFGGSGCKISFDRRNPDGVTAARLVSYLGGAPGIAFTDAAHTAPAPPLTIVQHDRVDHLGVPHPDDPRVGMVGGSYGGQIQFAAAAVDPRIDTIMPMITWNDLSYSLAPNNTDRVTGVTTALAGSAKINWNASLGIGGIASGIKYADVDPVRLVGCPDYPVEICQGFADMITTGSINQSVVDYLRTSSVSSYLPAIRIPTLLIQGQQDTLFNLNEAVATYRGLSARGVPVRMIWYSGGHSGNPAPGDLDISAPDPYSGYTVRRMADWADHYLKDTDAAVGPRFAWFRDWISYQGSATPAYATADAIDVSSPRRYVLSGSSLSPAGAPALPATARFVTAPLGLPTTHDKPDSLGLISLPENDIPGTYAQWDTAPLDTGVVVVGAPTVTVKVNAPVAPNAPIGDKLVLFGRIVDVDPAGGATTVRNLVAPVRIPDVNRPFTMTMPAFVHRFAPGHRIRLLISAGSTNYRGSMPSIPVSITSGDRQVLTLPTT